MCDEVAPVTGIRLNLITERMKRGLTRGDAAKRIGTSTQSISSWEQGEVAPSARFLVPLCELYSSTPSYLLHREGMED